MKRYSSHRQHLVEKLKDPDYAAAYLNAVLEEALESNDQGLFQVAVRDVVEAHPDEVLFRVLSTVLRFQRG